MSELDCRLVDEILFSKNLRPDEQIAALTCLHDQLGGAPFTLWYWARSLLKVSAVYVDVFAEEQVVRALRQMSKLDQFSDDTAAAVISTLGAISGVRRPSVQAFIRCVDECVQMQNLRQKKKWAAAKKAAVNP